MDFDSRGRLQIGKLAYDEINKKLNAVAKQEKRSKSFLANEAIQNFLFNLEEVEIALKVKKDNSDKMLSSDDATKYLLNKLKNV